MNSTLLNSIQPDSGAVDAGFPAIQALGATIVVGLVSVLIAGWPRKAKDLPPGPAPGFFVGNRNQAPAAKPWTWFQELNEQYGDVVYLQMGSTPTIVLGSAQAAWDLLEKRSNIYSSRPRFIMAHELLTGSMSGLMAPYGDYWRRWRKTLHGGFMTKAADGYKPAQQLESSQLMHELLHTPDNFRDQLERYAASVIVWITFGRRVYDINTDKVVVANKYAMELLTSINIPGKYLVESVPILKHIPAFLAPWKAQMLRQRIAGREYMSTLVNEVRRKMDAGTALPSFTRSLLEQQAAGKLDMNDLEIAHSCSTPFGAGVETSSGTLLSFLLACAEFGPSFIPQAQAELDSVVGKDRLPTFEDYDDLPFIQALVKETLRWRPIAVLGGTPHAVTEEDHYKGFRIPKGSTIIAPLWGIHRNPKDFPEPDVFKPSRFMEKRDDYPGARGHSAFGWGRRICPGMNVAENSVFLNIARIMWAFNVTKKKDAQGKEIPVDIFAYTDGFNSMPREFACEIKVRSPAHAAVIERENEQAQEELKNIDGPDA